MAIRIHASWLKHQHHYLDQDPTYKGAYGLPLLRMTFDCHGNDPRMRNMNKRRTDIGRAFDGSGLGGKNKGTHFGITGCQSTHNVGGVAMGSDPPTSIVNTYPRSWDVSKPFVVGGSAFPRNSANGLTETIGMLACWAADAIKEYTVRNPRSLG
jgi:gluconate 2-dehydrogenase alpha chain